MATQHALRACRYAWGAVGCALALTFMVGCPGSSTPSAEFRLASEEWQRANTGHFDPFYEDPAYDDVVALLHEVPPANEDEHRRAQTMLRVIDDGRRSAAAARERGRANAAKLAARPTPDVPEHKEVVQPTGWQIAERQQACKRAANTCVVACGCELPFPHADDKAESIQGGITEVACPLHGDRIKDGDRELIIPTESPCFSRCRTAYSDCQRAPIAN